MTWVQVFISQQELKKWGEREIIYIYNHVYRCSSHCESNSWVRKERSITHHVGVETVVAF